MLALVALGGVAWMSEYTPDERLCLLSRWADVPCPSCGVTRGMRALLVGDIAGGFTANPLFVVITLATIAYFVLRVGFGRDLDVRWSKATRRAAWTLGALLLAANWVYVLQHHG